MALIPMTYLVKEGSEIPEDTVKKECKYCHSTFAVPASEAESYKTDACEDCKDAFDKDVAEAAAALMKNPSDAAETIKNALGK